MSDNMKLFYHLKETSKFRIELGYHECDGATALNLLTTSSPAAPITIFFHGCTPKDVLDILDYSMRNLTREIYGDEDEDITETYAVFEEE